MSLGNIKVGDEIDVLRLPAVTMEILRGYADASGDHAEVHLDEAHARAYGFPAPIAHGLLAMAWMGRAVTNWAGASALKALKVRFVSPVILGEAISCSGRVEAIDNGLANLSLKAVDQTGAIKLDGTATVALG